MNSPSPTLPARGREPEGIKGRFNASGSHVALGYCKLKPAANADRLFILLPSAVGCRIHCCTQRVAGQQWHPAHGGFSLRMRYNRPHEIVSIQPRHVVSRDDGALHPARSSAGRDHFFDCVFARFHPVDSACFYSFVIHSPKGSSAISRALSVATRPVQGGARADRTRRVRSQTRCEPFRFGVRSRLRAGGIVAVGSSTTG